MNTIRSLALIVFLVVALSGAAEACSVCFGDSESPQGRGLNAAVWTLMATTVSILGGAAAFFVTIALRARRLGEETEEESGELGHA